MADDTYDNLQLVGHHVPDFSMETDANGQKVKVPLPGMYEVGAMLGGRFVSFASYKAGNLADDNNVVQTGDQSPEPAAAGEDQSGVINTLKAKVEELEAKLSGDSGDNPPEPQS